ncbi:DUF4126 domain-containing protein [Lacihabitans lacunae]|jgi:hypothetical protein|uniref:DUF4126 domain-containing protein n=1 Tax=Lacihabitans lacunae TaxID=1028214 RepID=A0ABV7YU58_9BACT
METLLAWIPGLFLGVALSAGSGFRIFVPFLISNLFTKFGLVSVSPDFAWMASNTTTVVLLVACVFEIGAYYIPFIDNLLDTIALPASVVAGTLLTTQFLKVDDPMLLWGLGILAGGGVAGTVQAGTSLLRLGSTKFTGGLGNSIFASIENVAATIISLAAFWLPLFVGIISLLFCFWLIRKLFKKKLTPQ